MLEEYGKEIYPLDGIFVLIHSPLVGPVTWSQVADHLRQRGRDAVVPTLMGDDERSHVVYWRQEVEVIRSQLTTVPQDRPLILVGHSGAGALLPAIRKATPHQVVGYVFVDAGLPHPGQTRLEEMRASVPELAEELHRHLAAGGRFPEWTDEELRDEIPDDRTRAALLAELQPRALDFFKEPLPVVAGWPDAPCSYIQLSPGYSGAAEHARRAGWPLQVFEGGHFHMLVDPAGVAEALLAV
jgi:hypothetical protein